MSPVQNRHLLPLMFLRLESLFDKSFHGSCLLLSAFNNGEERVSRLNRSGVLTSALYPSSPAKRTLRRSNTQGGSPMREIPPPGSVPGVLSNEHSYRDSFGNGVRVAIEQHFR
jgi:hypothetical protein